MEGIITADLTDKDPPGFYLQANCTEQGTSAGIRVALDQPLDWLNLGDEIRLEGQVAEDNYETCIHADLDSIRILSLGNPLPDPFALSEIYLQDPQAFSYESQEGRLVSLPESLLLKSGEEEGNPLVCPIFRPGLFPEAGCALGEDYFLGITGSQGHPGLKTAAAGARISNLVGILSQGLEGYLLRLLDLTQIRVRNLIDHPQIQGPAVWLEPGLIYPTAEESGTPPPNSTPAPGTAVIPPSSSPVPSPTWYPIHLLLSEVLPNPEGEEPDLEWVEIYNPESYGIPLAGIKLGDEVSPDGKEGVLRFPDDYYIAAGEALVIANNGAAFRSWYGFYPDFELMDSTGKAPDMLTYAGWGGNKIQFSNTGDELVLIDPWDELIDQLAWGKSNWAGFSPPAPAPGEGKSLERYPPERDRDQAGDWRIRQDDSPGWLDRSPPTVDSPPTQIPSPTSFDTPLPSLTTTPSGTFIITMPPSPSTTPFPTLTLTPSPSHSLTLSPTLIDTPTPPPAPTVTPSFSNSLTPLLTLSPTTTQTIGSLPTLTPSHTFTPLPFLTITSSSNPTPTFTLSPTLTVTPSPSPTTNTSLILFNEIHADPHPELGDANGDGEVDSADDEFLELVLLGEESLDLSGWAVRDEVRTRFVFPEGTQLTGGCGLVLFGGGAIPEQIHGSLVFSAGTLGLNNSGDTVYLLDGEGEIITQVSYGPEGGQDQSLTCFPDLIGGLPLILHSEIPSAEGRLFSPGTRVDGSAFGECP